MKDTIYRLVKDRQNVSFAELQKEIPGFKGENAMCDRKSLKTQGKGYGNLFNDFAHLPVEQGSPTSPFPGCCHIFRAPRYPEHQEVTSGTQTTK